MFTLLLIIRASTVISKVIYVRHAALEGELCSLTLVLTGKTKYYNHIVLRCPLFSIQQTESNTISGSHLPIPVDSFTLEHCKSGVGERLFLVLPFPRLETSLLLRLGRGVVNPLSTCAAWEDRIGVDALQK